MNQDLINLAKESIGNCKATSEQLKSRIIRLLEEIEEAEKELMKTKNVRQSLEAALERLEEAKEKEGVEEEARERDPVEEEIIKENKEALSELEDLPEQTDEEKDQVTLEKADKLIKREKEKLRVEKKDWKKCSKCNRRPVAPWNTKGICSTCQKRRKTDRPYVRKN